MKQVCALVILFLAVACTGAHAQDGWLLYDMVSGNRYTSIACADTSNCIVAGTNRASAAIMRWTSDGSNWRDVYKGSNLEIGQKAFRINDVAFPTPGLALASCDSGMILRSTNKGSTWDTVRIPTDAALLDIAMGDSLHGIVAGSSEYLWKTDDGGRNWIAVNMPRQNELIFGIDVPRFGVYLILYIRNGSGFTMRTTDAGATWEKGDNVQNVKSMDFVDSDYGWLAGTERGSNMRNVIYATTNGGITWTRQLYDTAVSVNELSAIAFFDRSHGIATGNGATILRTGDGGRSWIREQSGLSRENPQIFTAVAHPGRSRAYVVSSTGHFFRKGDGTLWPETSGIVDPLVERRSGALLWPNPVHAGETMTLVLDSPTTEGLELSIVTQLGIEIRKLDGQWSQGSSRLTVPISGLPAGTYYIRIQGSGPIVVVPFVQY